jgi:hypothetical protein
MITEEIKAVREAVEILKAFTDKCFDTWVEIGRVDCGIDYEEDLLLKVKAMAPDDVVVVDITYDDYGDFVVIRSLSMDSLGAFEIVIKNFLESYFE